MCRLAAARRLEGTSSRCCSQRASSRSQGSERCEPVVLSALNVKIASKVDALRSSSSAARSARRVTRPAVLWVAADRVASSSSSANARTIAQRSRTSEASQARSAGPLASAVVAPPAAACAASPLDADAGVVAAKLNDVGVNPFWSATFRASPRMNPGILSGEASCFRLAHRATIVSSAIAAPAPGPMTRLRTPSTSGQAARTTCSNASTSPALA